MLALRLARGARPIGQLRRLLVAFATAGVGFLLLTTLTHALDHPETPGSAVRLLLWCLVPIAATAQFAAAVARLEPGTRSRSALDVAGLGPAGLPLLAAMSTAVACLLGSVIALLVFLHLRGPLTGMPFGGAAAELLAADQPLPVAAALTLLCFTPLAASVTAAMATRSSEVRTGATSGDSTVSGAYNAAGRLPVSVPVMPAASLKALPWGVALAAAGLALETMSGVSISASTRSTALDNLPPGVIIGCMAVALGLIVAGPGLVHLCGKLTASGQPTAVRLLAGRALQQEAERLGRPWGVLCAVAAGGLLTSGLFTDTNIGGRDSGAVHVLGAVLVVGCAAATAFTVAVEVRTARTETKEALVRLGAPEQMLWATAAIQVGALLAALLPMACVMAFLTASPLP